MKVLVEFLPGVGRILLKISFWFSAFLFVFTSLLGSMAGEYAPLYRLVTLFALPGIFIKARIYRIAATLLFCACLVFAYQDFEAGKRREVWMHQLEEIQKEHYVNP
ncbi:MAG TPA: hypothetical protein VL981_10485 [Candidatus Methylacidiphilales bacterium]|nr:hypothetical protein [Candidatus Methylacidiphilales bacterium]